VIKASSSPVSFKVVIRLVGNENLSLDTCLSGYDVNLATMTAHAVKRSPRVTQASIGEVQVEECPRTR